MPHIKIGLVTVLSVICKTIHGNLSVNMYNVNIKIKTKWYSMLPSIRTL